MEEFKTIRNNSISEIIEKKSKFVGYAFYVENTSEAEEYINKIKKEHYDARHHIFAYSIRSVDGMNVTRFSDDGEPSGTAGAPVLKIIEEKRLENILIIVVRYFGGILLGTGGLVRAYSEAAQECLKNTEITEKCLGYEVQLQIEYGELEKLKYYTNKQNIKITNIQYFRQHRINIGNIKKRI